MTIKKNNLYKSFKYKKIKITLYIKLFIYLINKIYNKKKSLFYLMYINIFLII